MTRTRSRGFESSHSFDDRWQCGFADHGRGHLRELTIRLQETVQGISSGSDNGQTTLKVLARIWR